MQVETAIEKKSRGLICTSESVLAILAGRKTQTRRVMKPQPKGVVDFAKDSATAYFDGTFKVCPYGKIGDTLWVKETLFANEAGTFYAADEVCLDIPDEIDRTFKDKLPSILMPKWAARIHLQITNIRVERLQEISRGGLIAEGVSDSMLIPCGHSEQCYTLRHCFRQKWNEINSKRGYSWESNPYVWVIEFKVLTVSENQIKQPF